MIKSQTTSNIVSILKNWREQNYLVKVRRKKKFFFRTPVACGLFAVRVLSTSILPRIRDLPTLAWYVIRSKKIKKKTNERQIDIQNEWIRVVVR